jgi:hypothetical protein
VPQCLAKLGGNALSRVLVLSALVSKVYAPKQDATGAKRSTFTLAACSVSDECCLVGNAILAGAGLAEKHPRLKMLIVPAEGLLLVPQYRARLSRQLASVIRRLVMLMAAFVAWTRATLGERR